MQVVFDYNYHFLYVVVSGRGSVHNSRIISNSNVKIFKNGVIPSCERVIVPGQYTVPACLLQDATYALLFSYEHTKI